MYFEKENIHSINGAKEIDIVVGAALAQEEKASRASIYRPVSRKKGAEVKGKYSAKYALSDIMICAECRQPYCRSKYGQKRAVWRCDNRLKHGSKRCRLPNLKGRNPV